MANESPLAESAATRAGAAPHERIVLDDLGIRRALVRIAHEIVERNEDLGSLYIVGVPNGGVPLARQLAENLREITGTAVVVGILDTTLYRDDLLGSGERPPLRRTEMPSAVDDRDRDPRRRRVLDGPHRARRDGRADGLRPSARGAGRGADRPRATASSRSRSTTSGRTSRRRGASASWCAAGRASLEGPLEVVVLSEEGEGR